MNKDQISFEIISNNLKKFPPIIQEGKLRELLSASPACIEGWHMLINLVLLNGNHVEAVRLSKLALKYFKSNVNFLNANINLLFDLGMWDDAQNLLDSTSSTTKKNIEIMLDTIEIKFAKHPTLGLDVFQKYLEEHPKSFRSTVGMLSAQSISKYGNPSICFYLSFPWHWSIQEPIVQELDGLKTSFYVTTKKWALKILQPKVVVISDATPKIIRWIRVNLPHTKIVSTRHGIAVGGKNFGLQAAAATDFICVSSESIKKDLCKRALLNQDQVWVTGFPQMDSLFKDANLGFNNSSFKSVTYAPTYDPKLSSIEVIGDNPVQWIRGNNQSINLTIRPHPHLFFYQPELMNRWKEIIRLENNVVLDDSPFSSLSALLNKTDLLISDVSSVALQFIALDKPIICVVDIEKAKLSDKFAPDEIEWKMHAGTKLVNRSVDLPSAVESSLIDGDSDSILAERSRIRKYLFGDMTDGNAGVRIAQRLTKLQAKCSVG